ncbi:hypothetical protein POL68_23695 [Stigmatella sp. ncwal1]|uniref:Lipoprotein n=1 Tax=Stigmatella ashevillensis TaxID=2995309 RepID=A0ABT5DCU5_9BACT|nr:hypothetical protein [Stigmatella ashevillena]MDC0711495.1 hypothetical protein [Stigmatella ashevillena]
MRGYVAAVGLLGALCASGCSFMDKHFRKVTYVQGSMGEHLNHRFKTLVQQCRVVPADEKVKPGDYEGRNFLPNNFAMTPQELEVIPITQSWHSSLLFLYPFTQAEMEAYIAHASTPATPVRALNEQHLLSERDVTTEELAFDILPRNTPGIDAILYRQSCATYVSANSGGGVSLPLASVQSALDAQLSSGGRASLATGFFESPFTDMLDGGGARSLYARMLLWERYRRSPELLASPVYGLKAFKGAVLLGAAAQTTGTKLTVDASVGGGTGSVSGRLTAGSRYEGSSEYSEESFKTLIPSLDSSAFRQLEDPKAIQAAFRDIYTPTVLEASERLTSGKVHEHRFTIAGLPSTMCQARWDVSGVSPGLYESPPSVLGLPSVNTTQGVPQCTFVVRGMPKNSFIVASGPPAIQYTLTSDLAITQGGERVALAFTPVNLQFQANPNPQWTPRFASLVPVPEPAGALVRWRWDIPFDLNDVGNPVDRQREMAVQADVMKCPGGREVALEARVSRDEVTQQYTLSLRAAQTAKPPAGGLVTEPCELIARLDFPVADGSIAPRERRLVLDMPKEEESAEKGSTENVSQLINRLGAEQLLRQCTQGVQPK